MTSTISFPTTELRLQRTKSDASLISRHTTAVEVCNVVYGQTGPTSWDTLERFYEPGAIINTPHTVYENPVITATSRDSIGDIHSFSQSLAELDVPKPTSLLRSILGLARDPEQGDPLFQISRMWTEIDEVLESESFDGHRRCIVEHTLNMLLLPGLHSGRYSGHMNAAQPYALTSEAQRNSPPNGSLHVSFSSLAGPPLPQPMPTLPIPGVGLALPSPFHLQLRVFTRLSFNEQGKIIHHRDVWDLKDLVGLVPGGMLSQWIASRLAARALSTMSRLGAWVSGEKRRGAVGSSGKLAGSH
ncbi:hypothetical protein BC834DRAFT_968364 [Gloeopeniophorella convolvens]|nr:hypothetical protein BC834DRAFT_968364 [Gloeopeniophorella convolvens]